MRMTRKNFWFQKINFINVSYCNYKVSLTYIQVYTACKIYHKTKATKYFLITWKEKKKNNKKDKNWKSEIF